MIFVNFDHVTYFVENSEFLQNRLSAAVNVKVTWSDWKTQLISSFDSKDQSLKLQAVKNWPINSLHIRLWLVNLFIQLVIMT